MYEIGASNSVNVIIDVADFYRGHNSFGCFSRPSIWETAGFKDD
jgi:hypothetical protein